MNIEERITKIEMKLAHQENTVSELNDVIYSQQRTIDKLTAQIMKLETALKSMSSSDIKDISEEVPPPHY
ncbi:MAG: SlyX family protein [Spirochaetes bacterium]|nr:SlyX family protein [Spirochaetota bacterium]